MAVPARVTFAASAVRDLEELLSYFEEQLVPDVGARLLGEIIGRIADLEIHPDMGRVVPEFGRENLRDLIHPPFRIVYRHERAKVRIVRVWRSERLLKLPG
jgi:plasmid stabilization system protein ParE